jgi:hypothetical protein
VKRQNDPGIGYHVTYHKKRFKAEIEKVVHMNDIRSDGFEKDTELPQPTERVSLLKVKAVEGRKPDYILPPIVSYG